MAVVENKKENKGTKRSAKKTSVKEDAVIFGRNIAIADKVLIEPWITEKTHSAISDDKYSFKVAKSATKKQVKMAIEDIYSVKVEKMTIVNTKAKMKSYGRYLAVKPGMKKATVTLKKGDKIELFKGA